MINLIYFIYFFLRNTKLFRGLQVAYEISESGVVIATVEEGKIIYANKAFLEHIDHTIDELRETPFIDFVQEEYKDSTVQIIHKVANNEIKLVYKFTNTYKRKDGKPATCIWQSGILKVAHGNSLYCCNVELK